jgi:cysteine-rich repeat protein
MGLVRRLSFPRALLVAALLVAWGCGAGGGGSAVCGNGIVEAGEDCDFGAGNGPGSGCEATCRYSCKTSPDSCDDGDPCNGAEVCVPVTVNGQAGQRCQSGTALADCTPCGGGFCGAGACRSSVCGDGCRDSAKGEQCDDGNTANLDGCDATCRFEQVHRVNWLKMQFVTDAYCTRNAIGRAVAGLAQGIVQQEIDGVVLDGSLTNLLVFRQLDDLSGTTDPSLSLGVCSGAPAPPPAGSTYGGAVDLDWWYVVDPQTLDGARTPLASMAASVATSQLEAGPAAITFALGLGGAAPVLLSSAMLRGAVGPASVPTTSTGTTPGHLAIEHLDPTLQSFASVGQPNANGAARLCGDVSAGSLATQRVPAPLAVGGSAACSQGYTSANSLLDLLVGGCTALGLVQVVSSTQPDATNPGAASVGAGPPYALVADASRVVTACRDATGASVDLPDCLQAAAYSVYFKFTTDRVIAR